MRWLPLLLCLVPAALCNCPSPAQVANAKPRTSLTSFLAIGSSVVFSCDPGFTIDGSVDGAAAWSVTCTSTGLSGHRPSGCVDTKSNDIYFNNNALNVRTIEDGEVLFHLGDEKIEFLKAVQTVESIAHCNSQGATYDEVTEECIWPRPSVTGLESISPNTLPSKPGGMVVTIQGRFFFDHDDLYTCEFFLSNDPGAGKLSSSTTFVDTATLTCPVPSWTLPSTQDVRVQVIEHGAVRSQPLPMCTGYEPFILNESP